MRYKSDNIIQTLLFTHLPRRPTDISLHQHRQFGIDICYTNIISCDKNLAISSEVSILQATNGCHYLLIKVSVNTLLRQE